ncbi:MAG TPA: glycosyltransferase family 39 protein [Vicinamibacteria bacterium]|nr:glycosyltransferase family 39 protein [Vicinamibacteria bacterium]
MSKREDWRVPVLWALAYFVFQVAVTIVGNVHGYGYFIDELYYIACARHLDWGYVDHPPLAPALLRLNLALFGDSVTAIRLPSVLAGALTVALAGFITLSMGGGRFAVALASVSIITAPIFLVLFNFFSMNSLEILLWTVCIAVAMLMAERNDPRLWVVFGFVSGMSLENKHTVAVLAATIIVGFLCTTQRPLLWSPWLLVGGVVAFVLFLPNLLWQVQNGFPSLEFYRNATLYKNRALSPPRVLLNQILFMNPGVLLVWLAGVYAFWKRPALRFVSVAFLLMLVVLIVTASSRPDRLGGAYPVLFAGGAFAIERRFASTRARASFLACAIAGGLAFLPLAVPLFSPATIERYLAALGVDVQVESGEGKQAQLPQWLADRFGWEQLVADVTTVYESLPDEEKKDATILAPSYGHAGAIELLGRSLPPVISPHNSYFLWGRESAKRLSRGVAITLGYDADDLRDIYRTVERVAVYDCDFCMPWRDQMGIYVARGPKLAPEEVGTAWEGAKHFE